MSVNRACKECQRKKIRCDGTRPSCNNCSQNSAGNDCVYPIRKVREEKRRHKAASSSHRALSVQSSEQDSRRSVSVRASDHDRPASQQEMQTDFQFPGEWTTPEFGMGPDLQTSFQNQDMFNFLRVGLPELWQNDSGELNDMMSTTLQTSFDHPMDYVPGTGDVSATSYIPGLLLTPISTQSITASDESREFSLDVRQSTADDLIHLYFSRVHYYVPILHRPQFFGRYVSLPRGEKYQKLSKESIALLYAMMALSARYSSSPDLGDMPPKNRGQLFFQKISRLYPELESTFDSASPSLMLVQIGILLAYYSQSCGSHRSPSLVKPIMKMAIKLGLHDIDSTQKTKEFSNASSITWISIEEKRRAWWSIWELNAFDFALLQQPREVDSKTDVPVHLPVSDADFFKGTPVKSAPLSSDILQSWKSLKDSDNRDERAWFLVSNNILIYAFELNRKRQVSKKAIEELEYVIACFWLLYHDLTKFDLSQLVFEPVNYAKATWRIITVLALQSARIIIGLLLQRNSPDSGPFRSDIFENGSIKRGWEQHLVTDASIRSFHHPAHEVFRLCRTAWSPEYVKYAPPNFIYLVLGPEMMNLQVARLLRTKSETGVLSSRPSVQEELLLLVLGQFAKYWNIGSLVTSILT